MQLLSLFGGSQLRLRGVAETSAKLILRAVVVEVVKSAGPTSLLVGTDVWIGWFGVHWL